MIKHGSLLNLKSLFSLVHFSLTITNADAFTLIDRSLNGMNMIQPPSVSKPHSSHSPFSLLKMSESFEDRNDDDSVNPPPPPSDAMQSLQSIKDNLVRACEATSPNKDTILNLVRELEDMGEQVGVGQASSHSGLLAGKWSLLYATEDDTRSSPFFWAFRKTFPTNAEQIFSITDAIPAPLKEIGPATQTISFSSDSFVSRVKVATLNGLATSIMTTRCKILSKQGLDSIVLQVESTKPEKSTVLEKLGPLGQFLEENSQPFPSGEALEKVKTGGSKVVVKSTYCDEGIRISKDGESSNGEVYIWVRSEFEENSEV